MRKIGKTENKGASGPDMGTLGRQDTHTHTLVFDRSGFSIGIEWIQRRVLSLRILSVGLHIAHSGSNISLSIIKLQTAIIHRARPLHQATPASSWLYCASPGNAHSFLAVWITFSHTKKVRTHEGNAVSPPCPFIPIFVLNWLSQCPTPPQMRPQLSMAVLAHS